MQRDLDRAVVQGIREKIALGSRVLAKLELVDYLGHISARVPGSELVLIRARGDKQGSQLHLRAEQVTLVDLEAEHVEGQFRQPDETKLHTEIYKARPDVTSIVHTHQPLATIFGDLERPILPMQGVMASVVRDDIPVYHSARKVSTTAQGAELARVLGDKKIVHLQNHGVAIAGQSVEEVVINAIWLEHQAKLTLWASMIGQPRGMSRQDLEAQAKDAFGLEGRWQYYIGLLDD
ncbi:MAG: class II aldolase/adducin family protein [Candidatus Baltobacteraceae bacterium]